MKIAMENVCFRYKHAKEDTLQKVSFTMKQGDIIAILGDSGSGKSTILRLLAGLEKPYDGSIVVHDEIFVDKNTFVQPEKRGIGMVFQDYALFPHMTVDKNVGFGLSGMHKQDKRKRIEEVLQLVELEGYGKRYPHELSGGQQQRVALARALAPMPKLLLLDEPFSNLDAGLKEGIRNGLHNILKRAGVTAIFVTHDPEDAKAVADQVILLGEGKVIKTGKPSKIIV